MKPTLLILAAGMGSRYGGLKQLDSMGPNGETVLDYSIHDAVRAGFGGVVFVIRRDIEQAFREQVGSRVPEGIAVDYAFQSLDDLPEGFAVPEGREKPWGTAHAVYAARDAVKGPFAVINADDFYGRDAYATMAKWLVESDERGERHHYAMVGYRLENTLSDHGSVNRGICRIEDGLLESVEEFVEIERGDDGAIRGTGQAGQRVELHADDVASMNFWGFRLTVFPEIRDVFTAFLDARISEPKSECYIPTILDVLIKKGRADCAVLPTTSQWFGMTYPGDKPMVVESIRRLVEAGEYPARLAGN